MHTGYLQQAIALARVEKTEDGRYFASIPEFKGLWTDGDTSKECLIQLRSALEEWLIVGLREDKELPELAGISQNFSG